MSEDKTTHARAKIVAAILTDHGLPVSSPDEGDLDDVERERWNACVAIAQLEGAADELHRLRQLCATQTDTIDRMTSQGAGIGNWCWDGWAMEPAVATAFLVWLHGRRLFHCEGGWVELSDAWGAAPPLKLADAWRRA